MRYCRERSFDTLYGRVLPGNESMLKLARRPVFRSTPLLDEGMIKIYLQLKDGSTTQRPVPRGRIRGHGKAG